MFSLQEESGSAFIASFLNDYYKPIKRVGYAYLHFKRASKHSAIASIVFPMKTFLLGSLRGHNDIILNSVGGRCNVIRFISYRSGCQHAHPHILDIMSSGVSLLRENIVDYWPNYCAGAKRCTLPYMVLMENNLKIIIRP